MPGHHVTLGVALLFLTVLFLGAAYVRAPRKAPVRGWSWAGLAVILGAESLLLLDWLGRFRWLWVSTFFTPLAWTGYLLFIDGLVWSLRADSRLGRAPGRFAALAFWSIPLWLIFEAYNLRLRNWTYVGLPNSTMACGLGYVWSFATIWPAIFETSDFVQSLGIFRRERRHRIVFKSPTRLTILVLGLVFVAAPVLLPARVGSYFFGAVWIGFALLLDPLNYRWKGRSLLRDLEEGETSTLASFLLSGWICGILWEFWNYWASAKWLYVFPIGQGSKIFEMPLPGYLGFLPFAVECFAMYQFLRTVKNQLLKLRHAHRESVKLGV